MQVALACVTKFSRGAERERGQWQSDTLLFFPLHFNYFQFNFFIKLLFLILPVTAYSSPCASYELFFAGKSKKLTTAVMTFMLTMQPTNPPHKHTLPWQHNTLASSTESKVQFMSSSCLRNYKFC